MWTGAVKLRCGWYGHRVKTIDRIESSGFFETVLKYVRVKTQWELGR
jgi:hypothetical protein